MCSLYERTPTYLSILRHLIRQYSKCPPEILKKAFQILGKDKKKSSLQMQMQDCIVAH